MLFNVMIFSCDRPAQLDMLLRSFTDLVRIPNTMRIIAKATNEVAADGYVKLLDLHPGIRLIDETASGGFHNSVVRELVAADYFMPLVDDNVFIRPFGYWDAQRAFSSRDYTSFNENIESRILETRPEVATLSLRLGDGITRCYAMHDAFTLPPPRDHQGCFQWQGQPGDWGYPMSLDGNVFRTRDIYPRIVGIKAGNPNQLEASLAANPINLPLMCRFTQPRLINIPHNRVQNTFQNRHMGHDPMYLNREFLNGRRLAYEVFENLEASTVHVERQLVFRDEL